MVCNNLLIIMGVDRMNVCVSNVNKVKNFYSLVENNQVKDFMKYFSNDAVLSFSNVTPAIGKASIQNMLGGLLRSVNGVSHDIKHIWEQDDTVIIECAITFIRKDNRKVVLNSSQFYKIEDGLIKEQRYYIDITPVYS